jgi:uncharacterized protein YggE
MNKPAVAAIAAVFCVWLPSRPAEAQYFFDPSGSAAVSSLQNIDGFTVTGKGHVIARPDLVEIDLDVNASSELTADAIVKYRDAKRRIHDAFAALKLKNVSIDERGLRVDQKGANQNPYWFDYQPNPRVKTEVQLARKLVVRASDIRKLDEEGVLQLVGRLLDVAQDSGAKVGSSGNYSPYYYYRYDMPMPGLTRFVLEDYDKLQEEAYEKAVADARARAQRLARLAQVELGPIVAVRELVVPDAGTGSAADEPPRKRIETSKFQEIPIRVELLVRFEIHSRNAKGAAAQ